jgi:dimethylhistidine N-methyltransferase
MNTKFAKDVEKGLNGNPKYLESKYFYNERGDQLFQQIMELDEYYLTNCEYEILKSNAEHYRTLFQDSETHFSLVELGAGDGLKTKVLLQHFTDKQANFSYLPIDISKNVLNILQKQIHKEIPELEVEPYSGDYFNALNRVNTEEQDRKVVLFLGSTIGNFAYEDAVNFLKELHRQMKPKDILLIGFDLKKDPQIILNAYNDAKGVTAAFNLNLLERINQELDGQFDLDQFYHYPTYDPASGEAKSFLISKKEQIVYIGKLDQKFHFLMGEPIFMEISKKYDLQSIKVLAEESNFTIKKNFFDSKLYFTNSLWQKKS